MMSQGAAEENVPGVPPSVELVPPTKLQSSVLAVRLDAAEDLLNEKHVAGTCNGVVSRKNYNPPQVRESLFPSLEQ